MSHHIDGENLFWIATEQAGYFTTSQAEQCGFSRRLLSHYAKSGRFMRIARGLYRFRDYPPSPEEDVMAAWLAVGKDSGVVSHETALDLLDLTDIIPNSIHITVPRSRRGVSVLPGTTLHSISKPLRDDEVITRNGIRLTSPVRTLLDVAEEGIGPEQIVQGIAEALRRGLLTKGQLIEHVGTRNKRVNRLIRLAIGEATP